MVFLLRVRNPEGAPPHPSYRRLGTLVWPSDIGPHPLPLFFFSALSNHTTLSAGGKRYQNVSVTDKLAGVYLYIPLRLCLPFLSSLVPQNLDPPPCQYLARK